MENTKIKSLFSLTIPIFLELILVNIVGNIDVVMLGHYSNKAVGAVGGMSQVLNIQNVIFSFISLATTILCSQYIGARDKKTLKEVIEVSLILNLMIGFLLGLIYLFFWKFILQKINLPYELINIGKTYFRLVGGLCVFQAITLTCSAIMKGYGNTKQILFVNIGINLLNILGNAIFLFGYFGFPILGTTGVAISTVVSRFLGCIVSFIVMCKYCHFKFEKDFIKKFILNIFKNKILRNIISIGLPTAGENLAWNIGQLLILSMVNSLGTNIIASRTYLMLITTFIMTFSISLGHGTAIQVGHLVGAKQSKKAYSKCFKSLKLALFLAFSVTFVLCLFRYQVLKIFTEDLKIIEISAKVFPYMILLEVGRVFNIVIINSLHAAGDIKFPMFMGISTIFTICVPLSYFFGITLEWGLIGICIANTIDEWLRGIAMLFRWKNKKWQSKSFIK